MRSSLVCAGVLVTVAALSSRLSCPQTSLPSSVVISVQTDKPGAPYTPVWNFFGADEPNYMYAANGRRLLGELAALSSTPVYLRVHNLLTTGDGEGSLKWGSTNAYTEDGEGRPLYDWTITDRIFDAFQSAHVRPLVEIGFMPEALSTHPEPYRHRFPNRGDIFTGWSYPPRDDAKWAALVTAYVTHLKQRYGVEVDGWLWEVWNEPDIAYWHGTPEQYNRLYDTTVAAIRKVLPKARVGGPESTGPNAAAAGKPSPSSSEEFLRQFLEHCAHGTNLATGGAGAPLDFISFHPKGAPRVVDGHVQMDIGHQLRAIDLGMRVVASFPQWRHTPIILGENDPEGCAACGVRENPQNAYRNGPLYGVSVAEATARASELAARNGVTLEGSVTWAFEFENQPYFAGFRELATNGIDKAVLNVFRELGMLGGRRLPVESTGALGVDDLLAGAAGRRSDVNAVATRHPGEIDVLIWNYDDRDVSAPPVTVTLELANLRGLKGTLDRYLVDRDHGNAYGTWMKMGSPQSPTPTERAALERDGAPAEVTTSESRPHLRGHTVVLTFSLERQGVTLVRLR